MNRRVEKWCAWSGAGMIAFWLVGFWILAGFIPPPSPEKDPREVVDLFADDRTSIRLGLMFVMLGSPLFVAWVVAVSTQMRRIAPGLRSLADLQLATGTLLVVFMIVPATLLQAAAFRSERSPGTVQALYDLAWLMFVGVVSTGVLQALAIAAAIFLDQRQDPVFPRWAGYFNGWVAILFAPGALCVFFKDGPFAWKGVFAWWVPLVVFFCWIVVMSALVLRAANRPDPDRVAADDDRLDERVALLVQREVARLTAH